MATRRTASSGLVTRNFRSEELFTPLVIPTETVISPGGPGVVEDGDSNYEQDASATVDVGGRLPLPDLEGAVITNETPGVATIDGEGKLIRVTDGTSRVRVKRDGVTHVLSTEIRRDVSVFTSVWDSFVDGSLLKDVADNIAGRIEGKTHNPHSRIFTTQDHATPAFVRNSGCWLTGVDMTGISPSNNHYTYQRAGTAITRRHILAAKHFLLFVGIQVRFVDAFNNVVVRTITGRSDVSSGGADLTVYTLDSDLPASITHYPIAPANITEYVTSVGSTADSTYPPVIALDQQEHLILRGLQWLGDYPITGQTTYVTHTGFSRVLDIEPFVETLIGGDSGNPLFMLVTLGGQPTLVLLTVHTSANGGSLVNPTWVNTLIGQADADAGVSTGYTATVADFSAFTNFA